MPHATAPDGTRIAYQLGGRDPGNCHGGRGQGGLEGADRNEPPLLLLAGQSNNHHWWDPVRADFEAGRRTITLDYRGTGDSDMPDRVYSTTGFAEDAVAVLDDLGLDRVDVYGTSMGGRVAQWLAILHPERVRGLVLGCTSPGRTHGFERSQEIRRALAHPDQTARDAVLVDLMYTPGWVARNPGPYPVLGDAAMPAYAKGRHLVASNSHDAWEELPSIKAPTLVLHGTDDVFSPAANAQLLADRIPHARAELIPGARHAYFHEFHSLAGPLVDRFLRSFG
ncbi:alpha/beta hydrolase fold protein [Kribbella flavida DSM 17836]|uniref:Alpha/beta hydrolase fold protein n=1 Tax=Kribbella flavida (strain DSM 17836 / JCM 10339 / NBRC 14399) TaxID=479435 RepID=D2PLZ9_KRIFD|nr:alpha/beta fold hydrolase [Kribbella flavida]ADB32579.1 alpha/beta hydrolase fold protein [Kribbella flavida DSM 17836]